MWLLLQAPAFFRIPKFQSEGSEDNDQLPSEKKKTAEELASFSHDIVGRGGTSSSKEESFSSSFSFPKADLSGEVCARFTRTASRQ